LGAIVAALAEPLWMAGAEQGRGIVLAVDNGSLARARQPGGMILWKFVLDKATEVVRSLRPQDTVFLIRGAPLPEGPQGLPPAEALKRLNEIQPSVTGPEVSALFSFASDAARTLGRDRPLPFSVISLRNGPKSANESQWRCVTPETKLRNVGIVAFGSAFAGSGQYQALVRLKNFSAQPVQGKVSLEKLNAAGQGEGGAEEQALSLGVQEEKAVVFAIPRQPACPIRISWHDASGPDSFPEDDTIVAAPVKLAPPRIRFHGSAPALKKLYEEALAAEILPDNSFELADLEIYVRSVPEEVRAGTHAVMLLAPESGYDVFDADATLLPAALAQRDEDDELIAGIADKPEGAFYVPQAREIRHTGDFKSLIKDQKSGRTLVARFLDDKSRLGFLFAFVPGQESGGGGGEVIWDAGLAAILVRMARLAAGGGEPFAVRKIAELERRSGAFSLGQEAGSFGLLDEGISALALGRANPGARETPGPAALPGGAARSLASWLAGLALGLLALESWLAWERKAGFNNQARLQEEP
jgi:hypothetical protein